MSLLLQNANIFRKYENEITQTVISPIWIKFFKCQGVQETENQRPRLLS